MIANKECFSCKGLFKKIEGASHPYMESSPGCWACYGEVLSREYSNRNFFEKDAVHKLTVDTYAVQHLGKPSQQSIRSVGYHLIRLCLILDKKIKPNETQNLMVTTWPLRLWVLLGTISKLPDEFLNLPKNHKRRTLSRIKRIR